MSKKMAKASYESKILTDYDVEMPFSVDRTGKTALDKASDGHPIEGSYSFELLNTSAYVASANIEPCLIATSAPAPQEPANYWLLFGSLGLAAAGLFLYLRPRKPRSSN